MRYKYCITKVRPNPRPYRIDPNRWVSGPDPKMREVYYAWKKHQSQAWYRNETYELTYEDWLSLWPGDTFWQRGRTRGSLVLSRIDFYGPWSMDNVIVETRTEQVTRANQAK